MRVLSSSRQGTVPVRALLLALMTLALALSMAATAGVLVPADANGRAPAASPLRPDRDCGDFPNQAAAQRYFIDHGGPQSDPDRLDSDSDGVACESNPCPCSTDQGGGGGGSGGGGGGGGGGQEPRRIERGRIIKVVDGDTVDVRLGSGRTVRVRLIGIDTPEVYGGRQCWGPQASAAAERMLPRRTRVTLVSDRTQDNTDRNGRLLRYVTRVRGNLGVNFAQVARGNAKVYVYGGEPFERVAPYRRAQAKAERNRAGLWGACRR